MHGEAQGEGKGSVYRRKDGRVAGKYVDANGKRRYLSGGTKAEGRRRPRKLLADRDEGVAYDSENLTVRAAPRRVGAMFQLPRLGKREGSGRPGARRRSQGYGRDLRGVAP